MTIKEILKNECNNRDNIILYREGLFYKMYEHSAYFFYNLIQPFKVNKRWIKYVDEYVISMGFPSSSLDKWCSGYDKVMNEDNVVLSLKENLVFCEAEFEIWKNKMNNYMMDDNNKHVYQTSNRELIIQKLQSFPVEVSTPIECMSFICELKRLC